MTASFYAVTFDCTNAAELAEFWSTVLDQPVDPGANEDFASLGMDKQRAADPCLMFARVPEGKQVKNRVHVDLVSHTWSEDVERVIALGATRIRDVDENGLRWTTLADPEGNEFDIIEVRP